MDVHWFCVYQRVVLSLYYTLSYIFLLPHNLHQLTFLTLPIPEYATPHPDWSFTSPPTVSTANPTSDTPGWGWLLCLILLFRRQIWSCWFDLIVTVLLEVWRHCKFTIPPINCLPPSDSICCHPCYLLIPATYHIPFICSPPPSILPEAIFGPYPLFMHCWTTWYCPAEVIITGGSHTSVYWVPFPPHRECWWWGCIPHIYWGQRKRPKDSWGWHPPNLPRGQCIYHEVTHDHTVSDQILQDYK